MFDLKNIKESLTHEDAMHAVVDAFDILYPDTAGQKDEYLDLTPDGCLVVSIMEQIIVRFFIKRLMQLMTSEAVILNRNKIPQSYLHNYLKFQAHFSLKDTIKMYHLAYKATML